MGSVGLRLCGISTFWLEIRGIPSPILAAMRTLVREEEGDQEKYGGVSVRDVLSPLAL